jgi:intracellular sulfur oxidation DsrE/DsrF family protein
VSPHLGNDKIDRVATSEADDSTTSEMEMNPEDLIPGVEIVPSGALEVVRKEHDGFAYFKP